MGPDSKSRDLLELARMADGGGGPDTEAGYRRDPPKRLDWRATDLRGTNLAVVNLEGADLRGCDLRGCDLSDKNLRYIDLRGRGSRGPTSRTRGCTGPSCRGSRRRTRISAAAISGWPTSGRYLEGAILPPISQPQPADRDVAVSGQPPLENGHDRTGDVERGNGRER